MAPTFFTNDYTQQQAFIETGESNWCRLIDELRRTDGVRHDAPYVDFAPGEWRL